MLAEGLEDGEIVCTQVHTVRLVVQPGPAFLVGPEQVDLSGPSPPRAALAALARPDGVLAVQAAAMLDVVLHVWRRRDHKPHPAGRLAACLDFLQSTVEGVILLLSVREASQVIGVPHTFRLAL